MMEEGSEQLSSLQGVKFRETIVTETAKVTPFRHFGISPGHDSETPLGPLALFSLVAAARPGQRHDTLQRCLLTHFSTGLLLHTDEKGAMFPLIHFTDDRDSLKERLSDEHAIDNDYILHQGVYREVRSITPEGININGNHDREESAYIVMGFKSLDKNFSQEVMVNSWKEWTGARYIYLNLPDELGLNRISFYQREAPHSLNMFLYIMLVECVSVSSKEHQQQLLDFAQRLRAERMTGYVSVYGVTHLD